MKNDIVKECAANVRDTCYLFIRTVGNDMNRRELSIREITALLLIRDDSNTSISSISEKLGNTVSGASRLIDGLVELGLVVRAESEQDRRRLVLTLTEEGHRTLEHFDSEEMLYLTNILTLLKPAECKMVNLTMDLLRGAFLARQLQHSEELMQKGK